MLVFAKGRGAAGLQLGRRATTNKPSSAAAAAAAAQSLRRAIQGAVLRPSRCCIAHAPQAVIAPEQLVDAVSTALLPLLGGVRAHESALSAILILEDAASGTKVVVSSSLDKTIAAWRLSPNQDDSALHPYYCEVQKIAAPGGPIFSMAPSRPLPGQPPVKPATDGRSPVPTIFCGNAAKEVISWQPFMPSFNQFKLEGHTGWVRSVATYDKYLFSCGCNYLRQWDCTFATPKELNQVKLFTGDILAIVAGSGFVSTAGADGSLRSWSVDKGSGAMAESAVREHAHEGRICGLLRGNGVLYSCGTDGAIRMWSQGRLDLQSQALHAHDGLKVRCMALGGNGVLYTGGDDHMIRAWSPRTLEPLPDFEPLKAHSSAVRVLSAGKSEVLVSGDSEGYINFFQVPASQLEAEAAHADPFAHLFISSVGSGSGAAMESVCELSVVATAAEAAAEAAANRPVAVVAAEAAGPPPPPPPSIPSTLTAVEFDASLSPAPAGDAASGAVGVDARVMAAVVGGVGASLASGDGDLFPQASAGEPHEAAGEGEEAAANSEGRWFDECVMRCSDAAVLEHEFEDGMGGGDGGDGGGGDASA